MYAAAAAASPAVWANAACADAKVADAVACASTDADVAAFPPVIFIDPFILS